MSPMGRDKPHSRRHKERDPEQEYLVLGPKLAPRWMLFLREHWDRSTKKQRLGRIDALVDHVFEGRNPAHIWMEIEEDDFDLIGALVERER